jgi:2-iminobutanoate/2-iminopropanoate deaminase
MRTFIDSTQPGVPHVNAPISQAVVVGHHCYISGQLSTAADGTYLPGTVLEEAARAFGHVFSIAQAAGFAPEDLVFIDVAFIDLHDAPVVNDLFRQFFVAGKYPARTIYQAAALPYGGKVKVTAVGMKSL